MRLSDVEQQLVEARSALYGPVILTSVIIDSPFTKSLASRLGKRSRGSDRRHRIYNASGFPGELR